MSIPGSASPLFLAAAAAAAAPASYQIDRSLRFNPDDTAYLNKTPSSAGSRKKWTWSGWVKRSGNDSDHHLFVADKDSSASLSDTTFGRFYILSGGQLDLSGYTTAWRRTDALLRDPSAWYHLVCAVDTTKSDADADDRIKLYINGAQVANTDFDVKNNPSQNTELAFNQATPHTIGARSRSGTIAHYHDGYLAEVYFIDGQQLAASDFGQYDSNNVWQPKEFSGSYTAAASGSTTSLSQTGWQTSDQANIWDGDTSTRSVGYADNQVGTVTFDPPLTNVTKVEIYQQDYVHYLNGSSVTTSENGNPGWHTLYNNSSSPITLTSLGNSYTNNTQTVDIFAIRINDSIVDSQTWTPPSGVGLKGTGDNSFYLKFADNSSDAALGTDSSGNSNTWTANYLTAEGITANTSQTWSSSQTGYHNSNAASAFDGNFSTSGFATGGASANAYVDFSAINASKVEVYVSAYGSGSAGGYWYARQTNGTQHTYTITSSGTSLGWVTVYDGSQIQINRLGGARDSDGDAGSAQRAWRVDGKILINSGTSFSGPENTDSLLDTPTNYTAASGNNGGNYCTLNPLESALTGLNNGNLNSGSSGAASWKICTSTMAVSSGKYYWEGFTTQTATESAGWQWGFCQVGPSSLTTPYGTGKWSYQHGTVYSQSSSGTSVSTTAGANDLLAYALDMDAGTCKLYVNSSLVHTFTGITGTITPFVGSYSTPTVTVNFGQRPFEATSVPTGHVSLCTQNLSESAYASIADGSKAMDVKTWSGDSSERAITGYNFSPDFAWIKTRSGSDEHVLSDIVRGAGKVLSTSANNKESDFADPGYWGHVKSFDSNGFTVDNGAGGYHRVNLSGRTYVGWAWDAGTSNAASNTNGSITTNVKASQANGFSIVSYTGNGTSGATVGHGLSAAPEWVVCKDRDDGDKWQIYHAGAQTSGAKQLRFTTDIATDNNGVWNNTAPTNSVVTLGGGGTNDNSNGHIMYCWTPIEGYSSFGSYTGNGSSDGPFVHTGMRPAWLLLKESSSSGELWTLYDSTRNTFNVAGKQLYPSLTAAEADASASTHARVDFLANGFKIRGSHSSINTSGETIVYAAFAEHPFRTARAR